MKSTSPMDTLNRAQPERIGWRDLREIIEEILARRELMYQFVLRDIRIRYKQTVMGLGWAVLLPATIVLAGVIVRYAMAQFSGTPMDVSELGGVAVKSVPWAFFVGALQFGTNSLAQNKDLVQKVYFPREILPLSSVFTQVFDSTVGGLALVLGLLAFGVDFAASSLWPVPILLLLLIVFTSGTALLFSCANLFFRDVKYIVQVVLTFGIFFTPVFLEASEFGPLGSQLIMLNPIAPLLEGIRLAAIDGHNLLEPLVTTLPAGETVVTWKPWYLGYSSAWAIFTLLGAAVTFHRAEFAFAEYA